MSNINWFYYFHRIWCFCYDDLNFYIRLLSKHYLYAVYTWVWLQCLKAFLILLVIVYILVMLPPVSPWSLCWEVICALFSLCICLIAVIVRCFDYKWNIALWWRIHPYVLHLGLHIILESIVRHPNILSLDDWRLNDAMYTAKYTKVINGSTG